MESGPIYALCCAITWSLSIILFKKSEERLHSVVLNLFKNAMGFVLMLPTFFIIEQRWFFPTEWRDIGMMLISGVIGIGIADALFLASLKRLGASRSALVDCLYAPSVIFLSFIFFGETLSLRQYVGGFLVIGSILLIGKKTASETYISSTRSLVIGSIFGAMSMVFMAGGILLVKPLFLHLPLFWILAIRLFGGLIASIIIFSFLEEKRALLVPLFKSDRKIYIYGGSFLGAYISMMFWVAGFKYNDASIAAILNQSSTIFTVLLAAVFLNEALNARKICATIAAVSGVLLIVL